MNSWLSELGYTQRGPHWYSPDNKMSWTQYDDVWGLHIERKGYADYMLFKIETKQDLLTILRLVL